VSREIAKSDSASAARPKIRGNKRGLRQGVGRCARPGANARSSCPVPYSTPSTTSASYQLSAVPPFDMPNFGTSRMYVSRIDWRGR